MDKLYYSYKLAIIIPCWNCAKELEDLLNCFLQQTFQDWQVFLIDDLSTDNTIEVLQKYSKKDNRIHYRIRNRYPKGAQTCRNLGFDLSVGAEYVIWFDADDILAPFCFEQRVSYMDKHQELDFGIFPAKSFKSNIWDEQIGKCYGFPFFEDSLEALLSWTMTMVGWTNIYRRSSVVKYKLYWDEKILSMQDSDFNIQSIIKGLHFDYSVIENAKVDYFHRVEYNNTSVSHGIHSIPHFGSHIYFLTKISESLSIDQLKKYKHSLELYFFSFAEIIKKDPYYYKQLLNIPWVKSNRCFYFRLKLWSLFRFRMGYSIFLRDIYSCREKKWSLWKRQMKAKTHEIVMSSK